MSPVANLTCSDNQGQTVPCSNGFCQLIRNGISNVDRKCIPQGEGVNPSGILIGSNSPEVPDDEQTLIYACNKPMCNGAETDAQIRQLLVQYELLPSSYISASNTTETTTLVTNPTTSRSTNVTVTGTTLSVTSPEIMTTRITTMTAGPANATTTVRTPLTTNPGTNIPSVSSTTTSRTISSTTSINATSRNAAMTTLHSTIMNYQWVLLLIMTVLLKI
jgi:hypothetical protein